MFRKAIINVQTSEIFRNKSIEILLEICLVTYIDILQCVNYIGTTIIITIQSWDTEDSYE